VILKLCIACGLSLFHGRSLPVVCVCGLANPRDSHAALGMAMHNGPTFSY